MSSFKGRTIALAGCGAIGAAVAHGYADAGAALFIGDLDAAHAEAVAGEIVARGGVAHAAALNAKEDGSVAAFFAAARAALGGLDGVHINFADFSGAHPNDDLLLLPMERWDHQTAVNERGTVLCARAALPLLLERGGGTLLFTTSGAATSPRAGGFAYGMSKAAIHALMRPVAFRFGDRNIRSNAIAPGYVPHRKLRETAAEGLDARAMQGNAFKGRPVSEDDIAAMAVLLMSDAGATITGQVLAVDGGSTMRV